jgi:hypothetical protein
VSFNYFISPQFTGLARVDCFYGVVGYINLFIPWGFCRGSLFEVNNVIFEFNIRDNSTLVNLSIR